MAGATVTTGYGAYVDSGAKAKPHDGYRRNVARSNKKYIFEYLPSPAPRGVGVTVGKLRLTQYGAHSGDVQMTVQPLAAGFQPTKLKWSNQPAVTGTAVSVTKSSPGDLTVWEFDVQAHLNQVAAGVVSHYGWRISVDVNADVKVRDFEAGLGRPTLEVEWSSDPVKPSRLVPNGGYITTHLPTLSLDFTDTAGDYVTGVQVQV